MKSKSQMKREAVQRGKSLDEVADEVQTNVLLEAQRRKEREGAKRFLEDVAAEPDPLLFADLEHASGVRLRLAFYPPVGRSPDAPPLGAADIEEAFEELLSAAGADGFAQLCKERVGGDVSVSLS